VSNKKTTFFMDSGLAVADESAARESSKKKRRRGPGPRFSAPGSARWVPILKLSAQ